MVFLQPPAEFCRLIQGERLAHVHFIDTRYPIKQNRLSGERRRQQAGQLSSPRLSSAGLGTSISRLPRLRRAGPSASLDECY